MTTAAPPIRRADTSGIGAIQRLVAAYAGLEAAELTGSDRSRSLVFWRHVAMYLARSETLASLPEIGRAFGERDHTAVMHGISKIARLLRLDEDLREDLRRLRELLYAEVAS